MIYNLFRLLLGKVAAVIEKSLTEDLDLIGSWLHNNSLFLNVERLRLCCSELMLGF